MVNVNFYTLPNFLCFAPAYGHACYKNDFTIQNLTAVKIICIFLIDSVRNSRQRHAGILFTISSRLLVHVFRFQCFIVSSKFSC